MRFFGVAISLMALCAFTSADTFRAERVFKTMDDNKDGFVTLEDVRVHHREFYDALGADKDGHVTLAEAVKGKKKEDSFNKVNLNQDQHLTFEESFAIEEKRFIAADADKDGRVSYDEYLNHVRAVVAQ